MAAARMQVLLYKKRKGLSTPSSDFLLKIICAK
nr:MAG TPA: hypothetical protein [Caudoviricetes sp.]